MFEEFWSWLRHRRAWERREAVSRRYYILSIFECPLCHAPRSRTIWQWWKFKHV